MRLFIYALPLTMVSPHHRGNWDVDELWFPPKMVVIICSCLILVDFMTSPISVTKFTILRAVLIISILRLIQTESHFALFQRELKFVYILNISLCGLKHIWKRGSIAIDYSPPNLCGNQWRHRLRKHIYTRTGTAERVDRKIIKWRHEIW